MRFGSRLGVDVGSVRIGVARSDPSGMLATPVETVKRGRGDLDRIAELAAEHEVVEVIVGLPTSLSGREGQAAALARAFAEELAVRLAPTPVRLFDERLTTVAAQQGMRASGRKAKNQRSVIDQAAAVVLLQDALDAERATSRPPGKPVEPAATSRPPGKPVEPSSTDRPPGRPVDPPAGADGGAAT